MLHIDEEPARRKLAEAVLDVPAEVLALATDLNLADSALNAPAASFGGHEVYRPFARKAAVLCSRLCNNHPLIDGNKRVAYEALREFVARNGHEWIESVDDHVAYAHAAYLDVEAADDTSLLTHSTRLGRDLAVSA